MKELREESVIPFFSFVQCDINDSSNGGDKVKVIAESEEVEADW